jgi:uncharacterized protein YfaS (alpha-2-macroglobulin family)
MSGDRLDTERRGEAAPGEGTVEMGSPPRKSLWEFISKPGYWKGLVGVGLVLVVLLGLIWGKDWLGPSTADAGEVTITALQQDYTGVDPQSAFLLKTGEPVSTRTVKENLKVNPEFAYDLEKGAGGREYRIIPKEKLAANTVYRLSFDPTGANREEMSWAFQTRGSFRVIGQIPRNEAIEVPIDTGIEFILTHEEYDLETARKYFSITPHVEGRLEKHKKTLVFIPKGLQPQTIYTVTLKKGLPLANGKEALAADSVIRFETAPLSTGSSSGFSFEVNRILTEFSTAEAPSFPAYFNARNSVPPLHIDLYRYPDHSAFARSLTRFDQIPAWSYWVRNNYREDVKGLNKIAGFETRFIQIDQFSHYFTLPEPLAAGYYLAECRSGDAVRQIWFQVSDLAVYRGQTEQGTLFWVNVLPDNAPAQDIQVLVENRRLAVSSDSPGVVMTKENLFTAKAGYALLRSGDREILVPLARERNEWTNNRIAVQDYWKYVYLDRELYLPGDTVNFWGVLAPRKGGVAGPREITMELRGTSSIYYTGMTEAPLLSRQVPIKNHTFEGRCELPVLKPGYYFLDFKVGDTTVLSRGFSVELYHKPAYRLTVEPEKKAIMEDETTTLLVKAVFFEGTPVPGVQLNHHLDGTVAGATTDQRGEARIPLVGKIPADHYGLCDYKYISVNADMPEIGTIHADSKVLVFPSKVYLTAEAKQEGSGFNLKARLRHVDLNQSGQEFSYAEESFLRGPVANSQIKGALYEEIWNKIERGQWYDPINKKVVKTYDYQRSEQLVREFTMTSGQDGFAAYEGTIDPEKIYFVELAAQDSEGRTSRTRVYINSFDDPLFKYYYLKDLNSKTGYQPGETVSLSLIENTRELEVKEGRVLFLQGQDRIASYRVVTSPRYQLKFTADDIPNTNIQAVYFDGRNYHVANPYSVPFAGQSRALKVAITSNKAEYRPGEQVELVVRVTDPQDRPVKNARVNINLVDEALYALGDQQVDLLRSIYGDHYYLYLENWRSHYTPDYRGGAEKGGEGGGERREFRDTVLFTTLETGSDGRAETEIKLPDNLTSWRVTYHAVSPDLKAASGTRQIPVRLPFFVEVGVNDTYLEGDSPVVILRGYGTKLGLNQQVQYKMTLTGPRGNKAVESAKGKAFTALDWSLPQLEAGDYTLTVTAASDGYQDTVTRTFKVVKSLQERYVSDHQILKNGTVLTGSAVEPTEVIFCDYEKSLYLEGLYRLSWLGGSRVEQKLARQEARKLLQEYFPEEKSFLIPEDEESVVEYQQLDGGIGILPYASSDLALSALVACTGADKFDRAALTGYFYKILEEEEQDHSLALLGLAALDEPVLLQIKQELKDQQLAPAVRINLATALLELGDGSEALKVYREILKKNAQDLGSTMRIKVGKDQDDMVAATTQMAVLAARLNQAETDRLYRYILENPAAELVNSLEQIQILKLNLQRMNPGPVSFSYNLNGKTHHVSLRNGETFRITLLPQDLPRIKFSRVQGKVGVMTRYSQPYSKAQAVSNEGLSISRQYQVNGVKTSSLRRSDLVKVVVTAGIKDRAPGGWYEVADILPAGLAYVPRPYDYGVNDPRWSYPTEVKGKKLTFAVAKDSRKPVQEIIYFARVISPGEFRAEAPVISHVTAQGVFAQGDEERIRIK